MEYRKMTLDGWVLSGEGATAKCYFNQDDEHKMLKLFTGVITTKEYAESEFTFSRNVEACGVRTPKAIEMVEVDGLPGILYERVLNKKSVSRLCADDSDAIETIAALFARETKKLHATPCAPDLFPSRKERVLRVLDEHRGYRKKTVRVLRRLVESWEDTATCLHGDLQTGNLILANDVPYWIDLGSFAWGNPMFDIGCAYFFYVFGPGRLLGRKLTHMKPDQQDRFWNVFVRTYTESDDPAVLTAFTEKAKAALIPYLVYTIDLENYRGPAALFMDILVNSLAAKIKE